MKHNSLARNVVYSIAAALLAVAMCACSSTQSAVVAKFQATTDASGEVAPGVMARWDGDLFVGWAATYATCSIEPKGGGMPFYFVALPAGRMVVYQRSDKFSWSAPFPSTLPARARVLFEQAEIDSWGLAFAQDDAPTP